MASKLHKHLQIVVKDIFEDSLDLKYKRWMEWKEGVARYTERELAKIASDSSKYTPSDRFLEMFPDGYVTLWDRYEKSLNPIRFVGEGVQGRIQFYYLGMGKAYHLDLVNPGWKTSYFKKSLDSLSK